MNDPAAGGWDESAVAWLRAMGDDGDYGRRHVLDAPMRERIAGRGFETALDVGCGEGRFCRIMAEHGIRTVGVDPTEILIESARRRDPAGDYRLGRAESLDVPAASFDLVVSYLTLVDIPDVARAAANMVEAPGLPDGWVRTLGGRLRFSIDRYLEERAVWVKWRGIRIQNWHRPLGTYMTLFLDLGLDLRHFSEPQPHGGDPERGDRYRRVPWFLVMEWQKPALPPSPFDRLRVT